MEGGNFDRHSGWLRFAERTDAPTAGSMNRLAWAANGKARDALGLALEEARAAAAAGKFALEVEVAEEVDELALQSALANLGFGCKVFYGLSAGRAKMEIAWR